MARAEPLWRPWLLAAGVVLAIGLLVRRGILACGDPWPRIAETGLLTGLSFLLGLIVIDAVFGEPIGIIRRFIQAAHRFAGLFAWQRGPLWLDWAARAKNLGWALECLTRSANLGHPPGLREYGRYFLDGGMGDSARGAALPWLRRAAEAGDPLAAFFLAEMLRWGVGVAAEPHAALEWYLRSAQGGCRPAALWLAQAHLNGDGAELSEEKARRWSRQAEALGGRDRPGPSVLALRADRETPAGATAGEIYEEVGEALWAMRGYRILVVVLIGLMLATAGAILWAVPILWGVIVPVVGGCLLLIVLMRLFGHHTVGASREGKQLEARAAGGEVAAHFQLGLRYLQGHSDAPKDLELARRHFERSAAGGHTGAVFHLADLLAWGMGGPKDLARARTLLEGLVRTGHPEAQVRLQRLGPQLNPDAVPADQEPEGGAV